jgi:dephospho-CoA kinase
MTLCVGLTGGIGSGKSTVADLFAQQGTKIIDTDIIAHQITQPNGIGIAPIRTAFNDSYINENNSLNRNKMRDHIFSDPAAKQQLEAILHPLILDQCQIELQQLSSEPYAIIVIPLLAETPKFQQLVQRILLVDCPGNIQIKRVMQRNKMTEERVRAIISQQTPRTQQQDLADDLILNETNLTNLAEEVTALHQRYRKIAANN